MLNRWRSEIEAGKDRAAQLGIDMAELMVRMAAMVFVVGFVIGASLAIGVTLLWTR